MTLICPRTHLHRIFLASSVALLVACSSSSSTNNGSGGSGGNALDLNGFGQKYKLLDNEVSGWTQDASPNAFALYTDKNLTDRIDGPATIYIDHGMKYALYQDLVGPAPQICELVAMDLGTEANAKSMVTNKQGSTATITIPPYDASVAMASKAITGITIYANFKALYLELVLDGYGSDVELPRQVGATFLQALEAKTK